MASQTYLTRRNGIYYCRVAIPTQYRNRMGKREHWQSLGTRSYQEAIVEVRRVAAELFTYMEAKQVKARKLQSSDIPIIAEQHYRVVMASHEQQNAILKSKLTKANERRMQIMTSGTEDREQVALIQHLGKIYEVDSVSVAGNNDLIGEYELALSQGDYAAGKELVAERLSSIHEARIEYEDKSANYRNLCLWIRLKLKAMHIQE